MPVDSYCETFKDLNECYKADCAKDPSMFIAILLFPAYIVSHLLIYTSRHHEL